MKASALDLATVSGVAWGVLGEKILAATWDFSDRKARGAKGVELMRYLIRHLEEETPEIVFIEAPLHAGILNKIGASQDTIIMLNGLVMVAETVCESRGIETKLLARQSALAHFTGQPRFKEDKGAKKACMARARQLGWEPQNDNEGDAMALLDFGLCSSSTRSAQLLSDRPRFR